MRRLALAVLLCLAASACDKAATQKCDLGCRNYFKLHYWQDAEKEIQASPEADRPALRAKKESELEERMQKRVQCWIDARTAPEAEACKND